VRERILLAALKAYYRSRLRREWFWTLEPPHFFDHRIGAFDLAFGSAKSGPYPWFRAFFAADVIRDGDTLLDIGCGDGFFTARFLAPRCGAVDALDVEPDAIATARRQNAAANVRYLLADAVEAPFPRERYDVIVWDGAVGHFSQESTDTMLRKVRQGLAQDGIFCGSESLGAEGVDHLQFFTSLDDLRDVLVPHFPHVWLREIAYPTGRHLRREAFWRASVAPARHDGSAWSSVGAGS
jgi:SAM-dependent methyltransferase